MTNQITRRTAILAGSAAALGGPVTAEIEDQYDAAHHYKRFEELALADDPNLKIATFMADSDDALVEVLLFYAKANGGRVRLEEIADRLIGSAIPHAGAEERWAVVPRALLDELSKFV